MEEFFPTQNSSRRHTSRDGAATSFLRRVVGMACWFLAIELGVPSVAQAQMNDTFEGGAPRWLLVESDCQAELGKQELSPIRAHSGQTCERIELKCNAGTLVYLAYPIEPGAIIDEFIPSVWTICSSANIRIGVNVVFPNAQHPITGGRMHTILWGSTYTDTGQWQRLEVTGLTKLFEQEQVLIRQRFQQARLNLDGAYIDSIVINAYTGPGRYHVQLDDLNLSGLIPISSLGQPVPIDWRARWCWLEGLSPEEQRWSMTRAGKIPVWFQYQGESLPWLQSLGFRGVLLGRIPNEAFLAEARSARLDVICPPPSQALSADNAGWDAVKGWVVGSGVDSRSLDELRKEAMRLAQFPEPIRRPMIVEAMEQFWSFSRVADELVVPTPANISAGSPREKHEWLVASVHESKKRGSGWVSISTDPLSSWMEQLKLAHDILEPNAPTPDALDPWQLRLQVARAVAGGARGVVFRSSTPLEPNNPEHRARLAALRTANRDLAIMSPWLAGGQPVAPAVIDREDYFSAAWVASRSHLILFHTSTESSQYCLPPTRDRALKASMPLPAGVHQVVRLTAGRMERLALNPSAEGMNWTISNPEPMEICVLTDNPVVLRYLNRIVSDSAIEAAEDHLDVAAHQVQLAARIIAARWQGSMEEVPRRQLATVNAAQGLLDQGYGFLRASQASRAIEAANQTYDAVQIVIEDAFRVATQNLATVQTSPFVMTPSTLPYHWQMARACERSQWREVPLPGADLTDLNAMIDAGWSQDRRLEEKADLLVELVPAAVQGQSMPGLRLASMPKPKHQLVGGYEGASIRVRSAGAAVNKGELVRVSARAIVRRSAKEPGAGLLVYDNQAGPALGQLVRGNPGDVVEIELYRFLVNDEPFRILTELRGSGDIVLESLSLSAIEPATNRQSFVTTPR